MIQAYREDGTVIESFSFNEIFLLAKNDLTIYKVIWADNSSNSPVTFLRMFDGSWLYTITNEVSSDQGAIDV